MNAIHPLSEGCKKHLENKVKTLHLKKGQHLIKATTFADYSFYVNQGLIRTYYKNVSNKDVSFRFVKENECASTGVSIFDSIRRYELVHALEPTDISYIAQQEEQYLFDNFAEYNYMARLLLRRQISEFIHPKFYLFNLPSAILRYTFLLHWQPDLVNRVPVKYLASYVGMTESTLSKVRGQRIDTSINAAFPNIIPD